MPDLRILAVLTILGLFGLAVFYMIRSERKDAQVKRSIIDSLGFRPVEVTPELTQRFVDFHERIRDKWIREKHREYELRNVARKLLPDYEVIIFDLIDHGGNDTSYIETQAVAVISPHLELPAFSLFPKVNVEGVTASLGNKLITWIVKNAGSPVPFPDFPEFEKRYLVNSNVPYETEEFLNETRLRRLAKTSMMSISASGDMFTVSEIGSSNRPSSIEAVSARVNLAAEIYSIFVS
jgi:hypothetical protein